MYNPGYEQNPGIDETVRHGPRSPGNARVRAPESSDRERSSSGVSDRSRRRKSSPTSAPDHRVRKMSDDEPRNKDGARSVTIGKDANDMEVEDLSSKQKPCQGRQAD